MPTPLTSSSTSSVPKKDSSDSETSLKVVKIILTALLVLALAASALALASNWGDGSSFMNTVHSLTGRVAAWFGTDAYTFSIAIFTIFGVLGGACLVYFLRSQCKEKGPELTKKPEPLMPSLPLHVDAPAPKKADPKEATPLQAVLPLEIATASLAIQNPPTPQRETESPQNADSTKTPPLQSIPPSEIVPPAAPLAATNASFAHASIRNTHSSTSPQEELKRISHLIHRLETGIQYTEQERAAIQPETDDRGTARFKELQEKAQILDKQVMNYKQALMRLHKRRESLLKILPEPPTTPHSHPQLPATYRQIVNTIGNSLNSGLSACMPFGAIIPGLLSHVAPQIARKGVENVKAVVHAIGREGGQQTTSLARRPTPPPPQNPSVCIDIASPTDYNTVTAMSSIADENV